MENIIMLILGVFISVVGIVNIKGNISTMHSYNRRKVKEEDIPKYGKTVGTGTLIIGISLVLIFLLDVNTIVDCTPLMASITALVLMIDWSTILETLSSIVDRYSGITCFKALESSPVQGASP